MKISVSVRRPVQLVCAMCLAAGALAPASAQTAVDRGPATPAAGTAAPSAATTNPGAAAVLTEAQRRAGDAAWEALQTSVRASGAVKVTKISGPAPANRTEAGKVLAEKAARAQQHRAVAQTAKAFYETNPNHPKADEARKLEVMSELRGIVYRDRVHERAAIAAATAFRTDKTRPLADRLAVAHEMEAREIAKQTLGRPWYGHAPKAEMMLDRLRKEFGDNPHVWSRYADLARRAECDAGRDVALRVTQAVGADENSKQAARRVLERYDLVRKPLDLLLTPTTGRATTLSQVAGKTTVLVVWDGARHPEGPPGLHDYRKNPRPNTQWVYLSVGAIAPLAKGAKGAALPPGLTCADAQGWNSPAVQKLKLSELPYVFVLDEKKHLSGYGRVDEIPALLAGIGRPVLP